MLEEGRSVEVDEIIVQLMVWEQQGCELGLTPFSNCGLADSVGVLDSEPPPCRLPALM